MAVLIQFKTNEVQSGREKQSEVKRKKKKDNEVKWRKINEVQWNELKLNEIILIENERFHFCSWNEVTFHERKLKEKSMN